MLISLNWLQDFIALDHSPEAIAETLTLGGLEVEGITRHENIPGGLQGVVIGQVEDVAPHPNADRLRVCRVDLGEAEPVQIVCGAPNVAAGQNVPVAQVGAQLVKANGESLTVKRSKIRGEVSQGMICAEDELHLGDSHEGILVLDTELPPGTPLSELYEVQEDTVLEIGLTPNRNDAMSHYGVARDLAALLGTHVRLPASYNPAERASHPCPVSLEIQDGERCPHYAGLVIEGVEVRESPAWLRQRLEAVGQRPINNIVDATNYIMLGLGQPLHAFDLTAIRDQRVIVRTAEAGTSFTTLDGQTHELTDEDLVIAHSEEPMVLAGIMGGDQAGVTNATKAIFLESAYFEPDTIRRSVRRHGLHTETSYRFERGIDPHFLHEGLAQAATLILELAGGEASQLVDRELYRFPPMDIDFDFNQAVQLIGEDIDRREMTDLLRRLDIEVEPNNRDDSRAWLKVPPYRTDVYRQQDVVEELLRLHGFNQIPTPTRLNATPQLSHADREEDLQERLADMLAGMGWQEVMTNSLLSAERQPAEAVAMLNPLSQENAVLRPAMLPGMLEATAFNLNRRQTNLRFFEFGKTYRQGQPRPTEHETLALVMTGTETPPSWQAQPRDADLFSMRGVLERLATWLGLGCRFAPLPGGDETFSYGLVWEHQGQRLGSLGKVRRDVLGEQEIEAAVFAAELDWAALKAFYFQQESVYQPVPKHLGLRRDLSLALSPEVRFDELTSIIHETDEDLVQDVTLFDVYDPLPSGKKSYSLSIFLQAADRTLTEEEISGLMERIIRRLEADERIALRG